MSVLIKGMEMPMNCWFCNVKSWDYSEYVCPFDGQEIHSGDAKRHTDCPLIEIPDHGDLIDREKTAHEMWMKECYECSRVYDNNGCKGCAVTRMINVIACAETAPAVIPAERSEE